ncbi:tRNA (N6-threonylcarbamoyladenosine(37)-N6)-methyltransferase TrmO [Dethiosulfatarculus sandiegensis]|uniref:Methyltransferase n=1 Tax=Dethiosulfatarculus sandiegensis TaxID=1429043 RepID=A0A0D2GAH8_9BACT|nr:tRNA (N6-threonylcarbamoyladenosine(37)-N6)-methyltransferase TrmO [Dethiosulfatarculus sandiegensis]KIX11887.1 methyltransferase [Dethiosulfatarculus sandiegensis]
MNMQTVELKPIGILRTGLKTRKDAPFQGAEYDHEGWVELDPEYAKGLMGLEPGRDLWLLCYLNQHRTPTMTLHPRGDAARPLTGIFNTRTPNRPCPISLTLTRLLEVKQNRLLVSGVDLLDNTPVLDIKPYLKGVDSPLK